MIDVIIDTLLDCLKLIPFLFIAFLIIELIEHKFSKKTTKAITASGKLGPLFGGLLGLFPQCGFSVMATNLYVTRIISLGTLISIYLSTSDEMLPILLTENVPFSVIIKILSIKLIIGLVAGFLIDLLIRKNDTKKDYHICDEDHCDCEHGIFKSTIKHTLSTIIFILIITFLLNVLLHYLGEDLLSKIFLKNSFFGPFVASLVGLIPNCGASILLTELYLNGAISLSSAIAGLLTGSGVAILVLFKSNKNFKENIKILLLVYFIGVFGGIIIGLLGIV